MTHHAFTQSFLLDTECLPSQCQAYKAKSWSDVTKGGTWRFSQSSKGDKHRNGITPKHREVCQTTAGATKGNQGWNESPTP